jgi:hypothetical protein
MNTRHRIIGLLGLALLAALPAQAQLIVQSSVSPSGGMFRYEYQISNQTSADFSIVTLGGLVPQAATVQALASPAGFLASFDSGLGLLSFIEGTQPFLAGLTSGTFSFESPYAAGPGTFEAIDIMGGAALGQVAFVPAAAVPEPSTYALIGALLLLGLAARRRFIASKS